jgi:hypothetical protein
VTSEAKPQTAKHARFESFRFGFASLELAQRRLAALRAATVLSLNSRIDRG